MAMSLVILAIVLASFALGFRIADIRAEALDRVQRRMAEPERSPATAHRARTILPTRRHQAARRAAAPRAAARASVSAASAAHS